MLLKKIYVAALLGMAYVGLAYSQTAPSNVINYGGGGNGGGGGGSCTGSFCSATAPLSGLLGGTGVANTGHTFTFAGNIATTGANPTTFALGATGRTYTFPDVTDTVVTLTATQTLTNKTISGSSNTLSNIGNSSLTNSTITLCGTSTSLGGSLTASACLDNIGSTQGQILYRNATVWTILSPGTSGQLLQSGGPAANPSWVSSSASVSVTSASANIIINPTPGVGTFTVGATYLINAQTGTSYTIVAGDLGKLVTFSNGSATAVTLPQATGSFAAGASLDVQNKGAGTVTITPTTSTVNGSATLALATNQGCSLVSDGTNWQISACNALGGGAGTVTSVAQSFTGGLISVGGSPITSSGTLALTVAGTSGGIPYFSSSSAWASSAALAANSLVIGGGAGAAPATTPTGTGVITALGNAVSAAGGVTSTIASGTSAMGTSAISSGACASVVTTSATNTATTDTVLASFNGDPTGVTGYAPTTNGMLTIIGYPSANNVNFKVCNNTSASVTPGAITLNWRILR